MIVLFFTLILISFIQVSFLPFDLILLVIILRSFISPSRSNYWLGFGFGLLFSLLSGVPLGLLSLIYLLAVFLTQTFKAFSFSSHWLTIFPIVMILCLIDIIIQSFFLKISFDFKLIIYQVILTLPIFLLLKFWEERFVPKKEIRLKLRK